MKRIMLLQIVLILSFSTTFAQENNRTKKHPFQTISCSLSNGIKFEVIDQRKVVNNNHNYWATREVEFCITNVSQCPVFIRGTQTREFDPLGFFAELDQKKKQWIYVFWGNRIPKFNDLNVSEVGNYLLRACK